MKKQIKQKQQLKSFSKCSKQEQRMRIVRDALATLKHDSKIVVETGKYVDLDFAENVQDQELQTVLPKAVNCTVCALGLCMLSKVRLANNCKLAENDYLNHDNNIEFGGLDNYLFYDEMVFQHLTKCFSAEQLVLIECAFETQYIENDSQSESNLRAQDREVYDAIQFGERYSNMDEKDRLKKILQNILRNKGTFKPPQAKGFQAYEQEIN